MDEIAPQELHGDAHPIEIVRLIAAPVHRYAGRPGDGGVPEPAQDAHDVVFVRAGVGIVGDRFYAQPAHRRASITVLSAEAIDDLTDLIGGGPYDPALARRNIVVRGYPMDELTDRRFSIDTGDGPVELQGHRPARPCAWLDVAFGPGAQRALRGPRRRALRTVVLRDLATRLRHPPRLAVGHAPLRSSRSGRHHRAGRRNPPSAAVTASAALPKRKSLPERDEPPPGLRRGGRQLVWPGTRR